LGGQKKKYKRTNESGLTIERGYRGGHAGLGREPGGTYPLGAGDPRGRLCHRRSRGLWGKGWKLKIKVSGIWNLEFRISN